MRRTFSCVHHVDFKFQKNIYKIPFWTNYWLLFWYFFICKQVTFLQFFLSETATSRLPRPFLANRIAFLAIIQCIVELLFKVPVQCNSKLKFIKYKLHPGSNFRDFWLYINFFHALNVPDSNSEKLVPTFEYFQGNVAEGSNRLDRSYFYCIYPHLKI